MSNVSALIPLSVAVLLVNLPFGYWRAGTTRFSRPWFLAIHSPVPVVIALRLGWGVAWRLGNLPMLMGAYFLGQTLGGRFRQWKDGRRP
jgi:hypothetical protein